jgi:hypothetical protein
MGHLKTLGFVVAWGAMLAACGQVSASDAGGSGEHDATMFTASSDNGAAAAVIPAAGNGRAQVIDAGGLGRPTPALDVPLPPGWRFESAVRWDNVNGQCSYAIASPMFRMTSPDGKAAIELLPGFLVTTNDQDIRRRGSNPGDFCVIGMAESGQALAARVAAPFLRPGARVTGVEDVALLPEVAALAQRAAAIPQMGGARMIPYTVEATLALPDGRSEVLLLGGMISAAPQMLPGVPPLVLNQNIAAFAWSAPTDRLAETGAMARRVFADMRPQEPWTGQVNRMRNELTKPVFARPGGGGGSGSSGAKRGGGFDMDGWRAGQAADDDAQRRRIEAIREEQRCTLPDGTVVVTTIHAQC